MKDLQPTCNRLATDCISRQPKHTQERTETHACDCIRRADVEQTVEDNILCYTHSDRPIDQDHDTECHMAIRTALRMLRKDLRKLPSAQPEQPLEIKEILDYLDTALHPIVSPEHWNVYSELHDMISTLPSAQHEPIKINIDDFNKEDLERFKKELGNTPITVLPAQPEIIRCKDCKFYSPMNRETKTGICNLIMHQNFGDNWFCAGAERRPDE